MAQGPSHVVPSCAKKVSARHSQQNVSYTAQQGPYTNVYLITLSCPRIEPPQTANGRLQRRLQPHWRGLLILLLHLFRWSRGHAARIRLLRPLNRDVVCATAATPKKRRKCEVRGPDTR